MDKNRTVNITQVFSPATYNVINSFQNAGHSRANSTLTSVDGSKRKITIVKRNRQSDGRSRSSIDGALAV